MMKNDDDREVSSGNTDEGLCDRENDEEFAANLLTLLQRLPKVVQLRSHATQVLKR
jgi:hypothetical protein